MKQVREIVPTGVVLSNKRTLEVDAIIYCTGYRTKNSFLPPITNGGDVSEPLTARELYKLTIHPDLKNVAVVGFARGLVGAITLSTEMQARWWALLLSGKRELPEAEKMHKDVRYLRRKGRKFGQSTRTTMTYASSMARKEVGCDVDMFELFKQDKKLWWQVWNGPICGSQFRLFGVHAKPEIAKQQLTMPMSLHTDEYVDAVDVAYNLIPLAVVTIPIWTFLEKVLPGFVTRSALDSYI